MATYTTTALKEALAVEMGNTLDKAALYTTAPSASAAGTEVTGGAYERQDVTWTAGASDGQVNATVTFNVPAGTTVVGVGLYDGTSYRIGADVTSQSFASDGTYTVSLTASAS